MGKKLQREFRNRRLTPEEIARDEQIRSAVQSEFPSARPSDDAASSSLTRALKQAIRDCGQTEYQIAKQAGVSQIVISRFLSGERDIRMATADKLAGVLGLKIRAES
jgi:hypothetical protein